MIAQVHGKINLEYSIKIETSIAAKGRKRVFAIDRQMSLCYDKYVGAAMMLPSFL